MKGGADAARDAAEDRGAVVTGAPLMGALGDDAAGGVDPYEYAETIVRDLAAQLGARVRDFRADLAALHTAMAALPETLKLGALSQSVLELRDQLFRLSGTVAQQAQRPAEELQRVGGQMERLAERVAQVEAYLARKVQEGAGGSASADQAPPPGGLLVLKADFDRVIGQYHESMMRVVGAVREVQLDIRDAREEFRTTLAGMPAGAPVDGVGAPPRLVEAPAKRAEIQRLADRLTEIEDRLRRPAEVSRGAVPKPSAESPTALASLLFGAWDRLAQPLGADALKSAVDEVLSALEATLPHIVRTPRLTKGSGLVAVCSGARGETPVVALVAAEDLQGQTWAVTPGANEMSCLDNFQQKSALPTWRALLAAAALVEQTRPGVLVVPVLVCGNGGLSEAPRREDVIAHGQSVGAAGAASRLLTVEAADLSVPGMLRPAEIGPALAALLG